jgi:LuxR family maltose regulon positive regulatory protein
MKEQLLTVKLYTPPLRPDLVPRPRLLQKLDVGLQQGRQLSLISAPAGYGKTTLVLEWLAALEQPHGWLSLDRGDNHPAVFLSYLVAALQQLDSAIGPQLAELDSPGSDGGAWLQRQLVPLINQLAAVNAPFVLVLDDYHLINELAIHEALTFLLEHQPPQMHLVITTRQDPLLPLSRLRSRSRLTEVRLSDLRFTSQEGATFLNETMALGLSAEELAALEARTEGWIAGLQLAALSLSRPEAGEATQAGGFTLATLGDDRHVVDYLMDEVLSRQPAHLQSFLLQTSILDRLCAPLCDALLGTEADPAQKNRLSAEPLSPSQIILEELEQKNVFIIPLDGRRTWYRYHHLFGNILQNRLQSADPALILQLHQRASSWFEQAGFTTDAVDQALLAEDVERALRLIERAAAGNIWASGNLPTLLNWSKRLPEAALLARPGLCLYYARGLFFSGQVETAERYLDTAERMLREREAADGGQPAGELWGVTFTNKATFAAMRNEHGSALRLAELARPYLRADDYSTHARIAHAVGLAHYFRGEVRRSIAAFGEGIPLAEKAGNQILRLDLVACLAQAHLLAGDLGEAEQVCLHGLAPGAASQPPAIGAVYLALAEIHYEQNRIQEAQAAVERSIAQGRKANWLHVLWQAHTLQARIRQATGDERGSQEAFWEAEAVAERYPLTHVRRMVAACRAGLALSRGYSVQAEAWAGGLQPADGESPDIICERERLLQARILLASGDNAATLTVLECLLPAAEAAGRQRVAVEALLLRGLALQVMGKGQAATFSIQRAVEQAAPAGLKQPFLQWQGLAGRPAEMAGLLAGVQRQGGAPDGMRFAQELLAALQEEGAPLPPALPELPELVEPLSKRELEVLALIAEGLSNPEVAERLYLSPNTVRVHTSNIYAKLGVHGRMAAVSKAQALRLLPLP